MTPNLANRGSYRWAPGTAVRVLVMLVVGGQAMKPTEAVGQAVGVEVEVLDENLHLLRIRDGGDGWVNAVALRGPSGGVLVDHAGDWSTLTVAAPVVEAVRAALREVGVDSLTYLVNTHWHGDHTAGNPHFPEATIVAHEATRRRLATLQAPWWFPDGIGPMDPAGLPDLVFLRDLTLTVGGERVHLWHFGPAHTDGDAVVYFESARVAHVGDLYHGLGDPSVGEDMAGLAQTLLAAANRMHPDTRIVTGHGGVTSMDEMISYARMLTRTIEHVADQLGGGADLATIQARGLPDEWAGTVADAGALDAWLQEIHRSLVGS